MNILKTSKGNVQYYLGKFPIVYNINSYDDLTGNTVYEVERIVSVNTSKCPLILSRIINKNENTESILLNQMKNHIEFLVEGTCFDNKFYYIEDMSLDQFILYCKEKL